MNLLVSVRSAQEALAALEGGADLIDVKEPSRGPLGRADEAVIAEVIGVAAAQRPVSAAMGELTDEGAMQFADMALSARKWGLAGCLDEPWQELLLELREATRALVVPCAYADAERARAPSVADVARFVSDNGFPFLLVDTWGKDGADLLTWLSAADLRKLVDDLHGRGVAVALAGSLTRRHALILKRIAPDWVGVRAAACAGEQRMGMIDAEKVRVLKSELAD